MRRTGKWVPISQLIFAFKWSDPEGGYTGQLTWTRLPQGLKDSPTLCDDTLSANLLEFRQEHPEYVDDLTATETEEDCRRGTEGSCRDHGIPRVSKESPTL